VRRMQIVNVDLIKQKMYLGNVQLLLKNIETYKKEAKIQAELSSVDWFVESLLLKPYVFLIGTRLISTSECQVTSKLSIRRQKKLKQWKMMK